MAAKAAKKKAAKKNGAVTYLEAIREALFEEMARDPTVFVIGEDVGAYGGAFGVTKGLFERFGPQRVIDTPISESLIVGAGTGAAMMGMRPVCEMQFADFISCAFDQVANQLGTMTYRMGGKVTVPLVIRCPSGGNIHGSMFHSQNPEGWFAHTPGLKCVCPSTPYDAKGLLKAAIRDPNPVLYFENKYLYRRAKAELPDEDFVVPIGVAAVRRRGRDLTIVGYGSALYNAYSAAETLASEDFEAEVIDLRTVSPLDMETVVESVRKTHRLMVVHEDWRSLGVGAEVAARVAEEAIEELAAPIRRVAGEDVPVPFSPPLEERFQPTAGKMVAAAREMMQW
jgi:2-oxoisovalerate dehydrogenase E1 component beta subunit